MKKTLLWTLLALPAAALLAQFPSSAEKLSATLDVKVAAGSNKSLHINKGSDYGGVTDNTKEDVHKMAISIDAGTLMHAPFDAQIEWFFLEKDLKTKRDHIFDHGSKTVTLKSGVDVQFDAVSKEVKSSVTKEFVYGMPELSPKVSGAKPNGWIVRITAGGNTLVVRASTPSLEDIANDPAQFSKLQTPERHK